MITLVFGMDYYLDFQKIYDLVRSPLHLDVLGLHFSPFTRTILFIRIIKGQSTQTKKKAFFDMY